MFPLQTSKGPPPSSRDSPSISKSISDNGTLAKHYVLSRRGVRKHGRWRKDGRIALKSMIFRRE
jgi:hypothetical protein